MIDLVYRNDQIQTIQAQTVYENDYFEYELGLNSKLVHKPALDDRGKVILFYALFKLKNGGYGFEVMSKDDIDKHAQIYSKGFASSYSPWKTDYDSMARKTVIKKLLKYAPLKTDFHRALNSDETIKSELAVDMTEVQNDDIVDGECKDIDNTDADAPV